MFPISLSFQWNDEKLERSWCFSSPFHILVVAIVLLPLLGHFLYHYNSITIIFAAQRFFLNPCNVCNKGVVPLAESVFYFCGNSLIICEEKSPLSKDVKFNSCRCLSDSIPFGSRSNCIRCRLWSITRHLLICGFKMRRFLPKSLLCRGLEQLLNWKDVFCIEWWPKMRLQLYPCAHRIVHCVGTWKGFILWDLLGRDEWDARFLAKNMLYALHCSCEGIFFSVNDFLFGCPWLTCGPIFSKASSIYVS